MPFNALFFFSHSCPNLIRIHTPASHFGRGFLFFRRTTDFAYFLDYMFFYNDVSSSSNGVKVKDSLLLLSIGLLFLFLVSRRLFLLFKKKKKMMHLTRPSLFVFFLKKKRQSGVRTRSLTLSIILS